ncbi:MAG: hypothetical protein FWB80_12785 [Defluviitaleaceae bacterium]|nr:hypothetical protein [Defluviitaleaceae bacterium]
MLNVTEQRIPFDDGFEKYPNKYVLLGHVEEKEGNIISGIPVAIADRDERDDIWALFVKYMSLKTHGELFLNYFGDVDSTGVYV